VSVAVAVVSALCLAIPWPVTPSKVGAASTSAEADVAAKPPASNPSFEAARLQWFAQGLTGGGAYQAIPFIIALGYVRRLNGDTGLATRIQSAQSGLKCLIGMPDTGYTAALNAKWAFCSAEVSPLFGAPSSSIPSSSSCSSFSLSTPKAMIKAGREWYQVPSNIAKGINRGLLAKARHDLQHGQQAAKP
jgi:hypothetical protein